MALLISHALPPIFRPLSSLFISKTRNKNKPCRVACETTTTNFWSINSNSKKHHLNLNVHFSRKFHSDYERKLDDVRNLLIRSREDDDTKECLIFVDAIQRLGVSCHYLEEIEAILKQHYVKTNDRTYIESCTLHDISLSFRLLRQRGYHVQADVFNNFKGKDGKFKGQLKQDIRGLLELYEAAHVSFEGEKILDEAEEFSKQLLYENVAADMDNKWSKFVSTRLSHPYQKSITRMTEKKFLRDLEGMSEWGKTLGELAKMDLLIGQSVYQEELVHVSEWWNGLGVTKELKHARNQPLKWYTVSMTILINDKSLSEQRVQLTKSTIFIYLLDDIFDLYGTPDELAIFTEAVDKWDYASMDMLPDYMKTCYKTLLDTTNEIGHSICEKYGHNPITTLKQTWTSLCRAFLVESQWLVSGDSPRAEDYLANGKVTSGVHVVLIHLFYLLGLGRTNEGAVHLNDISTLISSVAAILRLWDDLGSAKDEHQNGNDGSYMEYYMKDHPGLTYKQVKDHMMDMISCEWKRLNKACFHLNHSSTSFFQDASLNLARLVPLLYSYDDIQRLPILEDYVSFMLLNTTSLDQHLTEQEQVRV